MGTKITNKKTGIFKWILIGLAVLLTLGGYKYLSFNREMKARRLEMQEQRQVMIDFYKDQGLSDKEIEEKMQAERDNTNNGQRPSNSLFMIRRIMGGSPQRR